MSEINRGMMAKAQLPDIRRIFGLEYDRYPDEYTQIFNVLSSDKGMEEDVNMSGFMKASLIPEGTNMKFDSVKQTGVQKYIHSKFGKGYEITEEAIDDNQYPALIKAISANMGISMRQTKESFCANILNRCTNSAYTGYDGKELCATDHSLGKGGTLANEFAAITPLSEVAVSQMQVAIGKFKDESSLILQARGTGLIIPVDLLPEAQRIFGSTLRPGSAENDVNILQGAMPIIVNHYLSSATRYFMKTSVANSLTFYQRKPLTITSDTDFRNKNMLFGFSERYSAWWSAYLGLFGNGE